ncbi:MAG: symmetrical bis(5'-nucleosyl)-tetraphosphatase [Marinicellaceae bacterium]
MTTYVLGDIQGCFDALQELLETICFNPQKDKLIFCGDLVNRGGQSLKVLRWVYAHQKCCQVVLGNHDLSLLAQYYQPKKRKKGNREFKQIFQAKDCNVLMHWLRHQKILIHSKKHNKVIVHAGIYPKWSLKRAKKEASRLENILQNKHIKFFKHMYGSKPNHWKKSLKGHDRTRFAVNSFTRMRFLFKNSGLNFNAKGSLYSHPKLIGWLNYPRKIKFKPQIIFGHWSSLGLFASKSAVCIDSGKVWGRKLTALKLTKARIKSFKKSKHIVQT